MCFSLINLMDKFVCSPKISINFCSHFVHCKEKKKNNLSKLKLFTFPETFIFRILVGNSILSRIMSALHSESRASS